MNASHIGENSLKIIGYININTYVESLFGSANERCHRLLPRPVLDMGSTLLCFDSCTKDIDLCLSGFAFGFSAFSLLFCTSFAPSKHVKTCSSARLHQLGPLTLLFFFSLHISHRALPFLCGFEPESSALSALRAVFAFQHDFLFFCDCRRPTSSLTSSQPSPKRSHVEVPPELSPVLSQCRFDFSPSIEHPLSVAWASWLSFEAERIAIARSYSILSVWGLLSQVLMRWRRRCHR